MKRTYLNLLNGYYNSPAFSNCTLACHSLIMALLKKANSLGFREKLTATNHEMQHLSKIEAASTFFRIRNEMTSLEVDRKKVFLYKNGKKGLNCGEYTIRYDVLLTYSQFFQNNESDVGELSDDSQNFEKNGAEVGTLIEKNRIEKTENDHDRPPPENENEEKAILTGTTASDHTIILGAIMRKWGSQIIHQPPFAQVTAALQEHARETLLEAIERAPLVLKEPDRMKLVGFIIAVAEHPMWYLDKADVLEIQTEEAKERAKEKRLVEKCESSLRSALRDGAESEIYGYIRFLARHRDEDELATFGAYCPSLTKPLDYYQSIWDDPGSDAYE